MDRATLVRLWPHAPAALIDAIVATAPAVFAKHHIDTALRFHHFMAQISHESDGGTIKEENLSYSTAARIAQVWPTRFTVAEAQAYVHNPQGLAVRVYNGRMGNRVGSSDGYDYRGRGLLQITGRDSYANMSRLIGVDLVANPQLAFDPRYAFEIAAAEFEYLGALPYCDKNDIISVTKRVNGGLTGLDSRRVWFARWNSVPFTATSPMPVPTSVAVPHQTDIPKPLPVPPKSNWLVDLFNAIFKRR